MTGSGNSDSSFKALTQAEVLRLLNEAASIGVAALMVESLAG
jgi:hypothetical protein